MFHSNKSIMNCTLWMSFLPFVNPSSATTALCSIDGRQYGMRDPLIRFDWHTWFIHGSDGTYFLYISIHWMIHTYNYGSINQNRRRSNIHTVMNIVPHYTFPLRILISLIMQKSSYGMICFTVGLSIPLISCQSPN